MAEKLQNQVSLVLITEGRPMHALDKGYVGLQWWDPRLYVFVPIIENSLIVTYWLWCLLYLDLGHSNETILLGPILIPDTDDVIRLNSEN